MISTDQALAELCKLVAPVGVEQVSITDAGGRVLAAPVTATRDQPPFATSTMDGYAIADGDAVAGKSLTLIGQAAAGSAFNGTIKSGECVRIFTGAVIPDGTSRVVIQEDVAANGDVIMMPDIFDQHINIRPQGADFKDGFEFSGPKKLTPSDVMLLASFGCGTVTVFCKPIVAIISTGDELVQPGEPAEDGQIYASNSYGLKALLSENGAEPRLLPIARDNENSLTAALERAQWAHLIITIGGASDGDHDLVRPVACKLGLTPEFYKVAMRPGKPLMGGMINKTPMVGLPGNPVSSMVCGHIFILPMLDVMLGMPAQPRPRERAKLTEQIGANAKREHYMRGLLTDQGVRAFTRQDSGLANVFAQANCLVVRPPNAVAAEISEEVEIIRL